jgi:hypothetical protein
MSTLPAQTTVKQLLRIMLGNFPAKSKAYLRANCTQKLEFDDMSYCFRLPMTFVPSYMGNTSNFVSKGVSFKNEPTPLKDLCVVHQERNKAELEEFCNFTVAPVHGTE